MGYPGIKKKNKSRGISRGLGIKSYLKLRRGVTHLGGADSGEALLCLEFPGIKAKNLQIQGVFKKICPQIPPSCFITLDYILKDTSPSAHYFPVCNLTFVYFSDSDIEEVAVQM